MRCVLPFAKIELKFEFEFELAIFDEFFETYTLIDINEFTAFENEIKPEELTSNFKIGDKSVNFVCLHCNTMNQGVVALYRFVWRKASGGG